MRAPLDFFSANFWFIEKVTKNWNSVCYLFVHTYKLQKQSISGRILLISLSSFPSKYMQTLISPIYGILHKKWWVPKYVVKLS